VDVQNLSAMLRDVTFTRPRRSICSRFRLSCCCVADWPAKLRQDLRALNARARARAIRPRAGRSRKSYAAGGRHASRRSRCVREYHACHARVGDRPHQQATPTARERSRDPVRLGESRDHGQRRDQNAQERPTDARRARRMPPIWKMRSAPWPRIPRRKAVRR